MFVSDSASAGLVTGAVLNYVLLPTHTPGARYSKVTQATISKTVCTGTLTLKEARQAELAYKRAHG